MRVFFNEFIPVAVPVFKLILMVLLPSIMPVFHFRAGTAHLLRVEVPRVVVAAFFGKFDVVFAAIAPRIKLVTVAVLAVLIDVVRMILFLELVVLAGTTHLICSEIIVIVRAAPVRVGGIPLACIVTIILRTIVSVLTSIWVEG